MCAGREICTPAYRIDRRNFEYHVVEFVFSGNWKLESGGRTEELRPGALFAYGPGDAYSLEAGKGGELIKYFVTFSGPDAGKMLEDCGLSGARVRYVHQVRWIHDLFEQLLECSGLGPDLAGEIGNRLSELILLRVRSDAWSCDARQSDSLQTYSRCRSFIQENYLDVGSVDAIAKQCNVDPAYLARLCRGIRRNLERYPDRRWRSQFSRWSARPSRPGASACSLRNKLARASINPPSPPPWPAYPSLPGCATSTVSMAPVA